MRTFRNFTRVCLISVILSATAQAIGTSFLTVPYSPRELALGGRTAAVLGDASLSRGNPALIVGTSHQMFFSYTSWFSGVSGSSALIVQPFGKGSLGLSVRHMDVSDLQMRTETPTDDYIALFSASGTTLEATWGQKYQNLQVGISLRGIYMDTYVYKSSGWSADAGVLLPLADEKILIGGAILNVGSMTDLDSIPPTLPTTAVVGITLDTDRLLGVQWEGLQTSFVLGGEISDIHGTVIRIGGESEIGNFRLSIGSRISKEVSAVSAGMGLTFRRFVVDYSLEMSSSQLGIPHLISLRMTLP
ncbi:MAG: hypothetical protein QGI16_03100 [Candidatus Marinimicrobia bacterium]|jgi:hypothetical protein|nr:hypothetical protein [Candidatus Neomarinimicrobiota bacterium]